MKYKFMIQDPDTESSPQSVTNNPSKAYLDSLQESINKEYVKSFNGKSESQYPLWFMLPVLILVVGVFLVLVVK